MRLTKCLMAVVMSATVLSIPAPASAAGGVEVNHLGVNNTLVRVTGEGRYLSLPVQETADDAKINILVDGNIAETIYVRLAKSKTDYTVPFDMSPYKGRNVLLDVVMQSGLPIKC